MNRVVTAGGLDESGVDAAIVDQARNLARMLDKLDKVDPPLNLLRLYDSALTKLQRAVERNLSANRGRKATEPEPMDVPEGVTSPPALTIVEESPLAKLRREKQARRAG
ncbi:hypothetical protein [Microbacterium saperdae]|uniref:hypothetical protein n=1 Tax=Microbacterium saperdae TaxID=69368 RepID=UPI0011521E97|nr:hypothetical protein [Microbacterium saperdae]